MSIYDGFRRERGVRFRPLNEEDETARHKRGWDPRKTYAENMGHESLFDRPEDDFGWAEPTQQRRTTRPKPTRQVRELAAEGRGEDTEIAHVARGEYVIPRAMQTPELMAAFRRAAAAYGVPVERFNVGNVRNRINPNTGAPEFLFEGLMKGFSDFFNRDNTPGNNETNPANNSMSELPSVRDAARNYNFSDPSADSNGKTPEMRDFTSPWKTIDKDKLTGILYNEMSSFRGDPKDIENAMWATANVIKNRQIDGVPEQFGKGGTLASPTITDKEMASIHAGSPDAKKAYDMASSVADLITSAPDAFPSPWPYTQYNHRDTASAADHKDWGTPSMVRYGPFDTYKGQQWLNIYGPKRR